ncbi:MAG: hypothetical protein Q4C70_05030 [Planctomycetia bacterium]|nr:hypothetical protein [Planctomycetia bacterium]
MEEKKKSERSQLLKKVRGSLLKIYQAKKEGDIRSTLFAIGSLRGFFHGAGFSGLIPPITEHRLSAIDFERLSVGEARQLVEYHLRDGFEILDGTRYSYVNEILEEVLNA